MNIAVIGAGYVGLVTGACLAELGNNVVCVDIDKRKINKLKQGKVPIYEPGLEEIVRKNLTRKRLAFTTKIEKAVNFGEIIFICVGTPARKDGSADLSYLEKAAEQIAKLAKDNKIVVIKSTVPVLTARKVHKILKQHSKSNVEFYVISNPEFLREGSAVKDFMNPDRIVIGGINKEAIRKVCELYRPFNVPILETTPESAEIIKHASNSFLATKISFINMVANLCEKVNANIKDVALGIGLDKRIGTAFLNAGIGFGGSCFPKDIEAFIKVGEKHRCNFALLKEVIKINVRQRKLFVKKIEDVLYGLENKTIAVLGLAFKPNTDDIRKAPAIEIIRLLLDKGAKIKAYDPKAMDNMRKIFPHIQYCNNPYETLANSDAMVLITEWEEFKKLNFEKVKKIMKQAIIIDGRNYLPHNRLERIGFTYVGVGI
ncbi:MAG: UDP-glucose/GDP-mannose dehydrogenase family protein [Candidatus Diapherotrites archaeon]|nr:UDP-glucose/GDP-mannose dehydrogenase family protein [Candidatus Diapherotrites archaeon]